MKASAGVFFALLFASDAAIANEEMRIDAHLWNDAEGHPHIGGAIINTTSGTFAVLAFACSLEARFSSSVHYTFPKVIHPGETQLFDLVPDFAASSFAEAIAHQRSTESWKCESVAGNTPDGHSIRLTNYVAPPIPMP